MRSRWRPERSNRRNSPPRPRPGPRSAFVLAAAAIWLAGCGGDGGNGGGQGTEAGGGGGPASGLSSGPGTAPSGAQPAGGPQDLGATTPASGAQRRAIVREVHGYFGAIDAGDGAAVCALLAPGALRRVKLPVRRPSCAASLRASIGHPGPAGSPRWLRTRLVDADSVVTIEGGLGRFTGTVVHGFAGSREPSIEDDVIYLRRSGRGRWLIAKPSATFYRAIGYPDVPIAALRAP